jgi:hypothetical protein
MMTMMMMMMMIAVAAAATATALTILGKKSGKNNNLSYIVVLNCYKTLNQQTKRT